MKKKLLHIFAIAFIFFLALSNVSLANAQADEGGFVIKNFDTEITLNSDASFDVVEKIKVNFLNNRRGIFRFYPLLAELENEDKQQINKKIEINVKSITRNGIKEQYQDTIKNEKNSNFKNKDYGDSFQLKEIKIGNADKYINGIQDYEIRFNVKNAIIGNTETATLFWGVTGNQWNVPIEKSSVKVKFSNPSEFSNFTKTACAIGDKGSTTSTFCKSADSTKNQVNISSSTVINPGQGFNIQTDFPSKFLNVDTSKLNEDPYREEIESNARNNRFFGYVIIACFLSLPCIVIALALLFLFINKMRSPKGTGVIVPYYDAPDNLRPAQVGLIYDQSVDNVDNSATIIDLARRSFLKIRKENDDYVFLSQGQDSLMLENYEQRIYNEMFKGGRSEIKLSSLKNTFYKTLQNAETDLQNWAVSNKYFISKSKGKFTAGAVGSIIGFMGISIFIVGGLLSFLGVFAIPLWFFIAFTAIVVTFVIKSVNYKSLKGVLAREKILGLKQYIELAEKNRMNMLNAPAMTTELFEKLLPYAMVFGQHKAWAKAFEDIYITPPSWYEDNWSTFNTYLLVSSLNNASNSMNSVLSSSPSSSGSGFSSGGFGGSVGGGFGGGGGGSW